jgi:hypothetical protein
MLPGCGLVNFTGDRNQRHDLVIILVNLRVPQWGESN